MKLEAILQQNGLIPHRIVRSVNYYDDHIDLILTDGGVLTYTPKPAPVPVSVNTNPKIVVAEFGYPDSDGIGSSSTRRLIIFDALSPNKTSYVPSTISPGNTHLFKYFRGYESSDRYRYKMFLVSKMTGLQVSFQQATNADMHNIDCNELAVK